MSRVKFSHEQAEAAATRKSYAPGWVFATITAAEALKSKEKPEIEGVRYDMIKVNWKPLRDQNDVESTVGRGIQDYWCLPFRDDSWDDLEYMVTKKDGTEVNVQDYLRDNISNFGRTNRDRLAGLFPDECPARPFKDKETGQYMYKGEELDKADDGFKKAESDSIFVSANKVEGLLDDPSELIGRGCFVRIEYEPGSDFPSVKAYSAEPPINFKTGEVIQVLTGDQIMGGKPAQVEPIEEEVEVAAVKTKNGSNGKAGKPVFNPPKKTAKSNRSRA